MARTTPFKRPIKWTDLPEEMHQSILQYVDNSELLSCRLVNSKLRNSSDEILKRKLSFWNVILCRDFSCHLRTTSNIGVVISYQNQLDDMIRQLEAGLNPFWTGFLEIRSFAGTAEEQDLFIKCLQKMMELCGKFITSLAITMFDDTEAILIEQIKSLLANAHNLNRLAVSKDCWTIDGINTEELIHSILNGNNSTKLDEFIVYGQNSYEGIRLFQPLLHNVTKLGVHDEYNTCISDLKVLTPSVRSLSIRGRSRLIREAIKGLHLDTLSMNINNFATEPMAYEIRSLMHEVDQHHATLKSLWVFISNKTILGLCPNPDQIVEDATLISDVKFKQLTTLGIATDSMPRGELMIRKLIQKMSILKRFQLVTRPDEAPLMTDDEFAANLQRIFPGRRVIVG